MDEKLKNLIRKNSELLDEVRAYILSNKNWLYYFINNEEVFDLLAEHPNDWDEYVTLNIENFSCVNLYVKIFICDEYGDEKNTLYKNISLPGFEGQTLRLYNEYHDDAYLRAIKEKEEELEYFEKKVKETRYEIENFKNKKFKNND